MKYLHSLLLCWIAISTLQSQSVTLQQALQSAEQNRPEMKARATNIRLAQNADAKTTAGWLPNLALSGDMRYNTQLQKSVIPIGQFGVPGAGADETRIVAFGIPFQASVGLDLNQKVWDKGNRIERSINKTQLLLSENEQQQQRQTIGEEVAGAYFEALFQQEKTLLAQQSLERVQANVDFLKTKLQGGAALQIELDKELFNLINGQVELRTAQQGLARSLEELCFAMGWPQPAPGLVLADSLPGLLAPLDGYRPNGELLELEAAGLRSRMDSLNAAREMAKLWPTVSVYGNYSVLLLQDQLTPFSYIGAKVSLPLIGDNQKLKLEAQDYRLRQQIKMEEAKRLAQDYTREASKARMELELAGSNMELFKEQIRLMQQIYQKDQFRYQGGVLLITEVRDSEFRLREAENRYLQAVYDFLRANLAYRLATGGGGGGGY